MARVNDSGLGRLLGSWDRLLEDFPQMKRELLTELGGKLLQATRERIGGAGKVQGWQEAYPGSELGYVAVRPRAKTYQITKGGKQYAVGYVTNAIERGHRNRRPQPSDATGYHYTRGRNTTAATAGRRFYQEVRQQIPHMGGPELQQLAAEVARRMEGDQ